MPVVELLVGGILLGGMYALIAAGLNLIFGVLRVINFAHGEILALAALSTVSLVVGLKLPFWLALLLVPIVAALFGALVYWAVLKRTEGSPMVMSLLATYAISTILVNVGILLWGGGYRGVPGVLAGSVDVLGTAVPSGRLVAFLVAMGISGAVWWLLSSTRFGRSVRATSQAPELAEISGISIQHVRLATFVLGVAMAAVAGVLMAPTFSVDPQLGARFTIKAFAVIIVGGLGSYPGAIAASLLLGLVEVFGSYVAGAVIGSAVLYVLMLAVLLVRPRGLFGLGVRA
jgi:branched-chain amino acid transport system permease protein